jgi:cbb3-type cytochrome oxidase subunit 3
LHEDKFWESFEKGAEIWSLVVIVLVVSLILFVALRLSTKAMADRRTRKILLEGMKEDDGEAAQGERDPTARKK